MFYYKEFNFKEIQNKIFKITLFNYDELDTHKHARPYRLDIEEQVSKNFICKYTIFNKQCNKKYIFLFIFKFFLIHSTFIVKLLTF